MTTPLRILLSALTLAALISAPALAQPAALNAGYSLTGGPASALLTVSSAPLAGGEYSLAGEIALGSDTPAYAVPPVVTPPPAAGGFQIFLPSVVRQP